MKLLFTRWRKATRTQTEKGTYYGGRNGEYFRCAWCGLRIKENQEYNIVLTNDIRSEYWKYICGNPLVCRICFDLYDDHLIIELEDRAHELTNIHEKRYWWFLRRINDR